MGKRVEGRRGDHVICGLVWNLFQSEMDHCYDSIVGGAEMGGQETRGRGENPALADSVWVVLNATPNRSPLRQMRGSTREAGVPVLWCSIRSKEGDKVILALSGGKPLHGNPVLFLIRNVSSPKGNTVDGAR